MPHESLFWLTVFIFFCLGGCETFPLTQVKQCTGDTTHYGQAVGSLLFILCSRPQNPTEGKTIVEYNHQKNLEQLRYIVCILLVIVS